LRQIIDCGLLADFAADIGSNGLWSVGIAMSPPRVTLTALDGIPLVREGDNLAALIAKALDDAAIVPQSDDILVIAQKIVSKAEGRQVRLDSVNPSQAATDLAPRAGKDPRHVEMILRESEEVLRVTNGAIIAAHKLGFVMANAGVDQSNVEHSPGSCDHVLLLPSDPDQSATDLKTALDAKYGVNIGVVINDSVGRAWRRGVVGLAIGVAGMPSLRSLAGAPDLFGRPLRITEHAAADEVASAASLLMGQAGEGLPVVHVRGLRYDEAEAPARALIRPKDQDLFR
jgi:coenzyme F420-0:L-glutamate ligase / coenzyme F420-1:gamma-L-glutamate ligase